MNHATHLKQTDRLSEIWGPPLASPIQGDRNAATNAKKPITVPTMAKGFF